MERGTVLFVSHDSSAILNLCHRAIWLENGQIQIQGSSKTVTEQYLASEHRSETFCSPDHSAQSDIVPRPLTAPLHDMRLNFINQSHLRNDIEIFSFQGKGRGFGSGGARIVTAGIFDHEAKHELSWVIGGEAVCVIVQFVASVAIRRVVVGFFIKDRLGQILFGDNTHLTTNAHPISLDVGEEAVACFPFRIPILPQGVYFADVAVADGTPSEHMQLQWIHDAFRLESRTSSTSTGLIGVPFGKIEIRKLSRTKEALAS